MATHFSPVSPGRFRTRFGLLILVVGLALLIVGADPAIFSLDKSPITGFIQISVFLVGLALICIGGFIALSAQWGGREKTIAADIGGRLVATGYVLSFGSGFADIFGFGTHTAPAIAYFGPIQAAGVMIGEGIIIVGFILLIPFPERD